MRIKNILLVVFFGVFTFNSFALPKKFEIWFLSTPKASWLDRLVNPGFKTHLISQAGLQCQPMGEYCFDPQVGLYKKGEEGARLEQIDLSKVEENKKYEFMDVPKTMEREMINCDGSSFFDIFCGKTQKVKLNESQKLEIWIDVSSTMKQVDFNGFDKKCTREIFLENLSSTCPMNEKMKVYYFQEYRKEAGSFDRVCLSGGLNQMKNIVSDLKRSTAEHVIVVTDIFEAQEEFIDAVESLGNGVIRGLKEPFYVAQMKRELKRIRPLCE